MAMEGFDVQVGQQCLTQINTQADAISQAITALDGISSQLTSPAVWAGTDSQQFDANYQTIKSQLTNAHTALVDHATKLQSEITQQTDASAT